MRRAHVRVGVAVHFDGAIEDRVARQAVVVQVFNIHVPLSVGFAAAHAKARLGQRQRRPAMQPVARGVQAPVQGVELLRDGPMASGSTSMRNSAGRCHAVRMEPAGRKAGRDGDRGADKAAARNSSETEQRTEQGPWQAPGVPRTCGRSFRGSRWSAIGMGGCLGCAAWAHAHASGRGIPSPDFTPTLGQAPCRAVCGVAAPVDGRGIPCAPRLAARPGKVLARPREDRQQVLRPRHYTGGRKHRRGAKKSCVRKRRRLARRVRRPVRRPVTPRPAPYQLRARKPCHAHGTAGARKSPWVEVRRMGDTGGGWNGREPPAIYRPAPAGQCRTPPVRHAAGGAKLSPG
ncbi:hypothetical protein AcdelDRAFT_3890 [Acidovorax delafieldii 2AN]|uniref:Uncharacterized protein n=1 Tax=Acidovorax delafieldii 2AN TaxID=573060 RepID=C5TAG0_ACIDE|nr:hypothetical protein AcdelDRAFT_3890 [Acidovorax delafieldii 2AN]